MMEHWSCADCETKVPVNRERCSSCGYKRTEYDLAGAAEDTGEYLVNRISLPEVSKFEMNFSTIRIITAIAIGIGVGGVVITLIRIIF